MCFPQLILMAYIPLCNFLAVWHIILDYLNTLKNLFIGKEKIKEAFSLTPNTWMSTATKSYTPDCCTWIHQDADRRTSSCWDTGNAAHFFSFPQIFFVTWSNNFVLWEQCWVHRCSVISQKVQTDTGLKPLSCLLKVLLKSARIAALPQVRWDKENLPGMFNGPDTSNIRDSYHLWPYRLHCISFKGKQHLLPE